jgi:hypothetical protein
MAGRLEVERRNIAVPNLDGLYTELPKPAGLAVRDDITPEDLEALRLEAEGILETGVASRWGGRLFCFTPTSYESMSRRRIDALKKTIEDKKPEWAEDIRQAARASNDMYVIVALSGVPPYPAVAILENMVERGELPGG